MSSFILIITYPMSFKTSCARCLLKGLIFNNNNTTIVYIYICMHLNNNFYKSKIYCDDIIFTL